MSWYLALPSALFALLLLLGGAAALRSGWVVPWQRGHVHRIRLFGWAEVAMGSALALQASTALLHDRGADSTVRLIGLGCLFAGLALLTVSQRPAWKR
ncbi:hypothetical protein ABZ926_26430 [Streptomyces litmocidini]|uniref:hypothetical protein n=1 Tax=Streptomyces litmocidini TaxID=67318 RepID=UPI0033E68F4E